MLSIRPRILQAICALVVPFAIACERSDPDADALPVIEPAPAAEAPPPELRTTIDGFTTAWNGDDPEALVGFFTEDATAVDGEETYRGRDEIAAGWLQNVPVVSDLEPTERSVRRVGQDWRNQGTYTAVVSPPDAEPMNVTGTYDFTWTREADGEWRIRSSNVQPDQPIDGDVPDPADAPTEG